MKLDFLIGLHVIDACFIFDVLDSLKCGDFVLFRARINPSLSALLHNNTRLHFLRNFLHQKIN